MSKEKISKESIQNIEETIKTKPVKKLNELSFGTGSDLLDLVVGGGVRKGYEPGRIINIVGDKSSGKTFVACEIVASAFYKYGKKLKWMYDDCESGFGFDTKKLYDFEIMPMNIDERTHSNTVEELYCNVRQFLESIKKDELGIYVVDSLDGLSSEEMDEIADDRFNAFKKGKDYGKGSYKMGKPKYLSSEFFPQLADTIHDKNCLLIIISQVRQNIDVMSFEKYTRAGGKAMDFYCHTVLWLAQVGKIKKSDRIVGVTVKARTTKSKTARPYRDCFIHFLFDYGLDNIGSNVDFLYELLTPTGMVSSKKTKMQWDEKEELSREELVSYIEKNNLQEDLTKRVIDKWENIEDSIRTNRKPKYS